MTTTRRHRDVNGDDVFNPAKRLVEPGWADPSRHGPLTRFPFLALSTSSLAAQAWLGSVLVARRTTPRCAAHA